MSILIIHLIGLRLKYSTGEKQGSVIGIHGQRALAGVVVGSFVQAVTLPCKFIFGISTIRENGIVQIPTQAMEEYNITIDKKVYLFTGSKSTGGFCVTRKGLLEPSKSGHILSDNPGLLNFTSNYGGKRTAV